MAPLLFLLLSLLSFGCCSTQTEELCYGSNYTLPSQLTPPSFKGAVTYRPKVGQPKIVLNNGQALDPLRFRVTPGVVEMMDLTEQDHEAVLEAPVHSVTLRVKNCGVVLKKLYGSSVTWRIPDVAQTLEFSSFSGSGIAAPPSVVWSRTDASSSSGRGNVSEGHYEIRGLTQTDSGFYRFRSLQQRLLTWEQVLVQELQTNLTYDLGNFIVIEWPTGVVPSQVRFTRKGAQDYSVLQSGGRVEILDTYMSIQDSSHDDAGTYDALDQDQNLILRAIITIQEVDDPAPHWFLYVAITVFFVAFAALFGRFLWKKRRDRQRAAAAAEPAPPPVNYLKVAKSSTDGDQASV